MKKLLLKYGNILGALAIVVTTYNVNACCQFVLHQPVVPQEAKRLRKF